MKKYLLPISLSITFFIVGLLTLPAYGINWDAPYRMLRGQTYLHYFLTGEHSFPPSTVSPSLIWPVNRISRFDPLAGEGDSLSQLPARPLFSKSASSFYRHPFFNLDYFLKNDSGHPPLPDILAATTNDIFYQTLHWFDDTHSYEVTYLLISSLGVFIVSAFTLDLTRSKKAALVSGISLGLFPYFFAEAHFNMKDPLIASFFAASIWAFWHWVNSPSRKWWLLFTAYFTLGISTKWNIVFLPLILLPWLITGRHLRRKVFIFPFISVIIAFIFFVIIWPYTWSNPLDKILSTTLFYSQTATQSNNLQPGGFIHFGFNMYPSFLVLIQTPGVILIMALLGLIFFLKTNRPLFTLFLAWLIIPILRISFPHAWFYGGLRQVMELLPALAILSGLGFFYITQKLPKVLSLTFILAGLLYLTYINVSLHPNQNLYFNALVGGTSGAYQKHYLDEKSSYGNVYKEAVDWINLNAAPNANLALLDGETFALSPSWLRSDISISPYHFSGLNQKGEYIVAIRNLYAPATFAYFYPFRFLKPLYQVKIGGSALLTIFRNSPEYSLYNVADSSPTANYHISFVADSAIVDFGHTVNLMKLVVSNTLPSCHLISYAYSDELISLDHASYAFNERDYLGQDQVEYSFAAEPTRFIRISPTDTLSCFFNGQVDSISTLPR